jgi:hypothetical protein
VSEVSGREREREENLMKGEDRFANEEEHRRENIKNRIKKKRRKT